MDVIHFTPGSLGPENVRRHGNVAHLPLASGGGSSEISCLYLAPGGQIAVAPTTQRQLLLAVNGRAVATFSKPHTMRLEPSAGVGLLMQPGDRCLLESATGAIMITIEADELGADPCGISHPDRVMSQLWPIFESN
jgi:hypothetical protein